ncbi:DUF222 domain-containing protein [Microbacterium sp. YJN-G]|uniref:DUF222 domain-containing protein n=1 Tax=Microbacterium sp. YJN-G TaxID=2763257 RepID=UPI00187852E1|nr:DUF222 domain-containing protein [Microbacterium sp. YJN-G]
MTNTEILVEGEPVHLLLDALQALRETESDVEGMVQFEGQLSGDSGAALAHALGRIKAELQAADMRSFLPGGSRTTRTDGQRGADALILLIERLGNALDPRPSHA